jgi:hypothetical protein
VRAASAAAGLAVVLVAAISAASGAKGLIDLRNMGLNMYLVWNWTHSSSAKIFAITSALVISLASCSRVQESTAGKEKTPAELTVQKTFKSPEDAGADLIAAAKASDQSALFAIFGPGGAQVLYTGDATKDAHNLQDFVAAYDQMHRWGKIRAGGEVLHVGADNYTFPIPLGQNSLGQWYFDTAAGRDEILARQIGKNERTAIAACEALCDAEQQYFHQAHTRDGSKSYAQKFASDPGLHDGLYWPASTGETSSPLDRFGDFAQALATPGEEPKQFNGYYYRVLTKQGDKTKGSASDYLINGKMTRGFAILAYPVKYRSSGIMSFTIGREGVAYQKDLGEHTADIGSAMTAYNPGDGWDRAVPAGSSLYNHL